MFLKPKKGLRVIDPKTKKPLADEGEEKESSSYWVRRLAEGDVEEVKAEPKKVEPKNKNGGV